MNRLTTNAERLWSEAPHPDNRGVIETIYASALEQARRAFSSGAYRPALQLARAAEALAQVTHGLPETQPGDPKLTRRLAS